MFNFLKMFKPKENNVISINGKTFSGNNVTIINGKVTIDGVDAGVDSNKEKITIQGNVASLQCDHDVEVKGNVTGDVAAGGSVSCNDVGADVTASGSVNCDNVQGNVDAGGSVNCDDVGGSVKAGGSICRG